MNIPFVCISKLIEIFVFISNSCINYASHIMKMFRNLHFFFIIWAPLLTSGFSAWKICNVNKTRLFFFGVLNEWILYRTRKFFLVYLLSWLNIWKQSENEYDQEIQQRNFSTAIKNKPIKRINGDRKERCFHGDFSTQFI